MKTVILVPRRAHPERDKLWEWCKARWQGLFPDFPIYEGHHDDGPFNRSVAVNRAARLAGDWDFAIVIDADIFIRASSVRQALATAKKTGKVTWAHRRWRGVAQDWTTRIVADQRDLGPEFANIDMDIYVERTNPISWSCCIVIPRAVWDDLGGFDERFRGWGFEDMAFQSAICGLYGHARIEGDVYHLWHARTMDGSGRAAKGRGGYTAEAVTNARLGRRYMYALRRDYALHDRADLPTNEAERERDMANLKRDDATLNEHARRLKLPDWSDWWPTLEELRDGAKEYRSVANGPTVTVVVHTGGSPEAWPERSAYLRRSLASLTENITGPIVQRVVYSDWGTEHRDELAALAGEHGFYVAGDGHHGYTGSMQRMWTYIQRRAKGEYVFCTEDDFIYPKPVALEPMIEALQSDPNLAQIALLRDAFYQDERETGGVLGWPEPAFTKVGDNGTSRLEHRLFWTANPSLFRKSITARAWPAGVHSETTFGKLLLQDPKVRFAFWGDHEELTKHIGVTRAGTGY
jgi:hypothetical protein